MKRFFVRRALLGDGWAENIRLDIDRGRFTAITAGADPTGLSPLPGIAIPALPNLHSHSFQRAMAGLTEFSGAATDSFWSWRDLMYRFALSVTPDDVEAIAAYAFMEMLEGGFGSVGEFHYLHHDPAGQPYANLAELSERIIAAAMQSGIGLTLLPVQYQHGNFGGVAPHAGQRRFLNDPERFLRLHDAAVMAARALPGTLVGKAPHSLRAVTPEGLAAILGADETTPVHLHIAEQVKEVADCLAWCGQRPVEWLLANMPVDQHWCLVHATHLSAAETRGIAGSGATIGLCPLTEANLGDGIFNGKRFQRAGGSFGIGSDSNIEISAPAELKQLEYSQRLRSRARNVMSSPVASGITSTGRGLWDAALAGGTRALCQPVAGISVGQRADMLLLDDQHPDLAGRSGDTVLDALVFVTGKVAIRAVMAAGELVVENGRHHRRSRIEARYSKALKRLTLG